MDTPKYVAWWMKDNWEKDVEESRGFVLQAMRGDDIAYEVGPYAIEFETTEEANRFKENGLDELALYLASQHEGLTFLPVSLDAEPTPEYEDVEDEEA